MVTGGRRYHGGPAQALRNSMQNAPNADELTITVRGAEMTHHVGNGRLRYWAENMERIEPELLDWIDGFAPGSVFYDLGASIGLFSIYAAVKAHARVFAFEAEAQNFATLELNHYLNRGRMAHPLVALNLALSSAAGLGRIYCRAYGAGEHVKILDRAETRDTREAFEPEHVQAVLKQRLDRVIGDYGLPPPAYLKIDVDGAELEVLQGAERTLGDATLRAVFIETYEGGAGKLAEARALERCGFRLARKVPVARMRGGIYPELYNCVFTRA